MKELIIISYDAATTYTKHYVVETCPVANEGIRIGTMFVNGNLIAKCKTYSDAEMYVLMNR